MLPYELATDRAGDEGSCRKSSFLNSHVLLDGDLREENLPLSTLLGEGMLSVSLQLELVSITTREGLARTGDLLTDDFDAASLLSFKIDLIFFSYFETKTT